MPISDSPNVPEGFEPVKLPAPRDPVEMWIGAADIKTDEAFPRLLRRERFAWLDAVDAIRHFGVRNDGFTDAPYLTAHPEREIAEGRGVQMHCAACDIWRTFSPFGLERGAAVAQALLSAHEHNITRHPRRFVRSLHLDAVTRSELLDAVSTTKAARA